ncbi:hypothetical protein B4Q04_02125 [Zobellia sp. OII3]|uniref:hypothetical protein n=1 Tax=Zobellia sp. OII3 TaxID=2034520 RepID=UPI000B52A835|nr:hypothetical protein [Zobellia sp. OII3]OWW26505.1 hypothetical protein B4Q04_02125 [Zobellia sp. OII3]
MKIIGKEFRQMTSTPTVQENDVQGSIYTEFTWGFLYIYNDNIVVRWSSIDRKDNNGNIYGTIQNDLSEIRRKNLIKSIEKGKDPVSIGKYSLLDNNQIEMRWNFYYGEDIELIFKGEILLNGDALKGTFYKNGEVSEPSRVYYNIDKPLPDPLIPEDDEDIT